MPANAAAKPAFAEQAQTVTEDQPTLFKTEPAPRDFASELWVGIPKAGKTLGGDDKAFFAAAGFGIADKRARIDDYLLVDGPEFGDTRVRAFEMKPQQALGLIATGRMDAAIVGRDVVKEFNAASKGKKGFGQCSEILDLDMAPCTLTLAVKTDDPATSVADLNGRVVVTKYREAVESWARANKVQFAEIVSEIMPGVPISGGIEGYSLFDPRVTVIADMVESGESLVQYDYKPLGLSQAAWAPIVSDVKNGVPRAERRKYTDLPLDLIENLPGTVFSSRPVLVTSSRKMTPAKENALRLVANHLFDGAKKMGHAPVLKGKRMTAKSKARVETVAAPAGFVGHGWRW